MWCYLLAWTWGVGDVRFPQGSCGLIKSSLEFIKVAPILSSAAEDITVLISWHRVWMTTLLVGRVGGLSTLLTSRSERKTCVFFTEIGRIAGNVEDHVASMIVECGIRVGCCAI